MQPMRSNGINGITAVQMFDIIIFYKPRGFVVRRSRAVKLYRNLGDLEFRRFDLRLRDLLLLKKSLYIACAARTARKVVVRA